MTSFGTRFAIRQRMFGFLAASLLLLLMVGIPWGLAVVAGSLLPDDLPTFNSIQDALTRPDDGTLFLQALAIVGWLAWLTFAVSVLLEVAARLRGIQAPRLPALGVPQHAAATLISAAAVLFTIAPTIAPTIGPPTPADAAPAPSPLSARSHSTEAQGALRSASSPAAVAPSQPALRSDPRQSNHRPLDTRHSEASEPEPTYLVRPGDSLWAIADRYLGDGARWTEIADLNHDLVTSSRWLQPGWTLRLPVGSQAPSEVGGATGAPIDAAAARPDAVVVQPGDTLSDLALDELGDDRSWPQLYEQNRDEIGPDPDLILPGQVLTIPGTPASTTEHPTENRLLDDRPTEAKANNHQPDEAKPTGGDRSRGDAGADRHNEAGQDPETHRNPGTSSRAEHRADGSELGRGQPGHDQPGTLSDPAPGSASDWTGPTDASATDGPGRSPDQASEATVHTDASGISVLRALLASAVCLSAGLLGLLLLNRRRQFRQRRPGRTIAATPGHLVPVERTVLESGSAAQPAVEFLDLALRHLAASMRVAQLPLPDLGAAVLGEDDLTLLFTQPTGGDAPDGWAAAKDRRSWTLARSTTLDHDLLRQSAPYPALVSVGEDAQGRTWMLDLEALGICGISGPEEPVLDVTRFLVAELGVNAWSEDTQVLLTGNFASETVGLNPSRLRSVDDQSAASRGHAALSGFVAAAANLQKETLDLRRDNELRDTTGPVVIVRPGPLEPPLAALVDRTSLWTRPRLVLLHRHSDTGTDTRTAVSEFIGAGTSGLGDDLRSAQDGRPGQPEPTTSAAIELTEDGAAFLTRWGVELQPFRLPADHAAAMGDLVSATADPTDAPMPPSHGDGPAAAYTSVDGALLAEYTEPRRTEGDDPTSLLPDADQVYLATGATTPEDLAVLAPSVPDHTRTAAATADSALDQDIAEWLDADSPRPKVSVLGPVDVTARDGDRSRAANVGGTVEFIVYLACQEHGATKERAADALGWSGATVQNRARDARRLLGARADGVEWLPDAAKSDSARRRGLAAYQLHPDVLVDADLFRRLRTRGQTQGTVGIEDLESALSLVTGEPFDQLRRGGYGWLLEGDRLDHHLRAAIGDVSHLLVTQALAAGDVSRARMAAQVAVKADPYSDVARLDLAAVEEAATRGSADRVVREQVIDRVDADPTARTEAVLDQRSWMAR